MTARCRADSPRSLRPGTAKVAPFVERLVQKNLAHLIRDGEVHEVRAFLPGGAVRNGYFDSIEAIAKHVARLDAAGAAGVYVTLNPLHPDLIARRRNTVGAGLAGAKDADVLRRRWLPIDIDPCRPKDTSSTEDELALAIARADAVWLEARRLGWGDPLAALSGNGCHLLFRCDLPADDGGLVRRVLRQLDRDFTDDLVKIDTAVSNAARIWRVPGTMARKGRNTAERPWRRSALLTRAWEARAWAS